MSTKITTKTIDQETVILPSVVAEIVAEKAVGIALANELSQWENLDTNQRDELDTRYKKECTDVEDYLIERANNCFQFNKEFNKKIKGAGNKGLDYLYTFMYHWVGIHKNYTTEAGSYKKAMQGYKRDMKLHNA